MERWNMFQIKKPAGPAIINEAGLFVRGVTTSKYKTPIKSTTPRLEKD